MNTLNRLVNQSRLSVRALALVSVVAALAAGCASNPARVEEAVAADHPDNWASRIGSLPVEVHGAAPGETTAQTVAAIDHGTADQAGAPFGNSGVSLYAMPRVVVYIGGTTAPARDQYCSLEPNANTSVLAPKNGLVLRSELCDGPRPVAFARITLPEVDPTAKSVAGGIKQIKSDLVQSLPLPVTVMPVNYENGG
jgi:hypothetical protein